MLIRIVEVILMSIRNIGFYEELTMIIFRNYQSLHILVFCIHVCNDHYDTIVNQASLMSKLH